MHNRMQGTQLTENVRESV